MILPVAPYSPASVHILVVDDEPEIAESLAEFLARKEGYRISRADDGLEAIELLESSLTEAGLAIDLVLLDMRMPQMSGPEVLAWLRNHPVLQYTRVIVLTAAAGNQEKVEALSAGADDYITKPYYPQELLARVKTILRSQQLEKQLKQQSQQLATLNRVSRAATAILETDEVLAATVAGVNQVIDVELAAVFMVDGRREHLLCRRVFSASEPTTTSDFGPIRVGSKTAPAAEGRRSKSAGILSQCFDRRRNLYFNNAAGARSFLPGVDTPPEWPARNLLAAPLLVRGRAVGVLAAYNKRDGDFSEVDRDLFASLASTASRAVEISWLFQSIALRQQELLESRNALQAVIDGILHPIYTINEEWQLVAVNQTKAEELDSTSETLAGEICYQAFFSRSTPCVHCRVAATLVDKTAHNWPVSWVGPDHLPVEWEINAYPVPGSQAGSARAVVVWQDRTEERRLENSLLQAGKLAAIGQLAAGVAHEINNPLTAINANAQMLKMVIPQHADSFESVDLIARAGDRAARVVRGLLDFARQAQYSLTAADINDSIRQALELVAFQFTSSHVDVVADLGQDLPPVDGSWEHLKSVWLNLLINARDAVQNVDRTGQVEVITRPDSSGEYIQVLVRDNGRGMTEAELTHIFEPFYTTKDPGKGTGLGLATSHRVIEQHGGDITVTSKPDTGTTFVVRLPVRNGQGRVG